MKISSTKNNDNLNVYVEGRLDASWADFFTDRLFENIRNGEHKLILHCHKLEFLSSAGIRSLLLINKELAKVQGEFFMYGANDFVAGTIRTTGFGEWLIDELSEELRNQDAIIPEQKEYCYLLSAEAAVKLKVVSDWKPWEGVSSDHPKSITFTHNSFALGIGAPGAQDASKDASFGDFMVVHGHVIYQPPEEKSPPDYLFPLKEFFPEMLTIQSLMAVGEMQWLYRFFPEGDKKFFPVSELANKALELTKADLAVFIIIGEANGIVGANIIQSPANDAETERTEFPELRNWLSFTGEKVHMGEQAMIFGVASRENSGHASGLLKKLPGEESISAHFHASIFPYQPLQNGSINLEQQVKKIFNGPPPKAMLHLINDDRPIIGLGESTLLRGALWCAPVIEREGQI